MPHVYTLEGAQSPVSFQGRAPVRFAAGESALPSDFERVMSQYNAAKGEAILYQRQRWIFGGVALAVGALGGFLIGRR